MPENVGCLCRLCCTSSFLVARFLESPPANATRANLLPMQHSTLRQVSCGVKGVGCKYSHLPWKRCYSSLAGFALPKRKVLRVKRAKEELSYEDRAKRQQLLQAVASRLGVTEQADWYRFTRKDVHRVGGGMLFRYYPSLIALLADLHPECEWIKQKFESKQKAPAGYWKDKANLLALLEQAELKFDMKQPEDWYSVNLSDLQEMGFPRTLTRVQLAELLAERYPHHKWDKLYLLRGKYASQRRLESALASLFEGVESRVNARKEVGLENSETKEYSEIDIYYPSLRLGFEYQERHHYFGEQNAYQPLHIYQERDRMKVDRARENGMTLIVVPFWWDGTLDSLAATIQAVRPDLLTVAGQRGIPISSVIPPQELGSLSRAPNVEGVGEPLTAAFLTATHLNPAGWWMFEKYDGVRAFWNPEKKQFYSRFGRAFTIPDRIIDAMPTDLFLDGEIWFGRDNFQEAMKISNRVSPLEVQWDVFKYMVFDIPNNEDSYRERYERLTKYFEGEKASPAFLEVAPIQECKDMSHLEAYFQELIDSGGEGIIVRNPADRTRGGRSGGFLKHKKYRDAEARIVGSAGLYEWECELPNQVKFKAPAGTVGFAKKWEPKVGDIVTFKHRGFLFASKKPKLPLLYRVRTDITWDDVVKNWKEHKRVPTVKAVRRSAEKKLPKGYWNDSYNRRQFLLDFAKSQGFDPLQPNNWTKVTNQQIIEHKGGGILNEYNHSLLKTLKASFPEVAFAALAIDKKPKNYWANPNNRRQFFEKFANQRGFDPLDPIKWRSISRAEIRAFKGRALLDLYNGSLRKALAEAFCFQVAGRISPWTNQENCRKFFDRFAEEKGFDPLVADNWYAIALQDLRAKKGGSAIKRQYGGWRRALQAAYGSAVRFNRWEENHVDALQ